jgi:hypothetical protein
MKIAPEHIEFKAIAGKTKEGHPVVYVLTKGGLHAFFTKAADGDVTSLGAAPHRGIASWMAEKRSPGIQWDEDFAEKHHLVKSETQRFQQLREIMFESVLLPPTGQDLLVVYDDEARTIEVMDHETLTSALSKGEHSWSFVRPIDLSQPICIPRFDERYRKYVRS